MVITAGMSVMMTSHTMLPDCTIAFTFAGSGGVSSFTDQPVAASNGFTTCSRNAVS